MSDIRAIIEAVYADRFITKDKELSACGDVVREVEPSPRIEAWPFLAPAHDPSPYHSEGERTRHEEPLAHKSVAVRDDAP